MNHRAIVESTGVEYIGMRDGIVIFRDPETGETLTLYTFAVTFANTRLTLKAARERVLDFPPLLPTE